jgi:hypothetical protein
MIAPNGGFGNNSLFSRGNMSESSSDLRTAFQKLRSELEPASPSFHDVREKRVLRIGRPRYLRFLAAGVMLLAIVAFFVREKSATTARPETSITEWKAPTDFLLDLPGQEMLRATPSFGEPAPLLNSQTTQSTGVQ